MSARGWRGQSAPAPFRKQRWQADNVHGPQAAHLPGLLLEELVALGGYLLLPLHAGAPFLAKLLQHGAQAVDAVLRLGDGLAGMIESGVGFDALPVRGLEDGGVAAGRGDGIGLGGVGVGGMRGVEQDVADGLADAAGVERLELRVAAFAELRVRRVQAQAVPLPDELDDTVALVQMPHQDADDVPVLGADDFLEVRVVALVVQQRGDGGAQAAVLRAYGGDEDERPVAHSAHLLAGEAAVGERGIWDGSFALAFSRGIWQQIAHEQ
jgi:hypothetical protein